MMMQGPNPEQIAAMTQILLPLAGMATAIVIVGVIALGPVGRSIGDVLRHLFGGRKDGAVLGQADADEIISRLEAIQSHLGELAERQDFAERMLAQVRKDRAIAGGTDVSG